MDPRALEKLLQYLLDMYPINQGGAPAGAAPMSDPTAGSGGMSPPSDLNQWIDALSGRDGPPPGLGASMSSGPQDAQLAGMPPLNQGPPPGPTQMPADPPLPPPGQLGYGANEADARGWQGGLPAMEAAAARPEGMSETRIRGGSPAPHPPETLSFLQELLGKRPELMAMQSPQNPTRDQNAQILAVAIELMNEGLDTPVESGGRAGAGGLRSFMQGQGRTENHIRNSIGKKAEEASAFLGKLPSQVRSMISPDAAGQIAENPSGKLTTWAQELLGQARGQNELRTPGPSRLDAADPAPTLKLRTDQANLLLGAGPDRSSLLGGLSQGEGALARQMGGMEPFVTQQGGMTRDPAAAGNAALEKIAPGLSQMFHPEAGLPEPSATPPLNRRGQTAGQVGQAGADVFAALLGRISPDEGGPVPIPEESMGRPPMSLVEQIESARAALQKGGSWADFPPESTAVSNPANYPTRLDREVGNPPIGSGSDMLEGQQGGRQIGLDEAGNMRLGGRSGPVMHAGVQNLVPGGSSFLSELGASLKPILGGAIKGAGQAALSAAPNLLDIRSANEFAQALRGANDEYGGVMTPDSQGRMTPVRVDPNMAALWSMIPFLGLDRRRFQSDPAYRRQMLGPENIAEVA